MRKKSRNGSGLWQVPVYAVLIFWALTTIYPLFWVAINSFKVKNEILANSFSMPVGELFTLANYRRAFDRVPILGAYVNSLIPVSYTHLTLPTT